MRQFHVVWWKVTYCCCWGSRQMNTLLVSRGMFYSEWKPITQWIPRRRNAGSPVITLWFHPSLISIACYILSVIYRSQRALVLYLHFTPMPLNATQQIRLILTSNFFALDLVEVALNLFFSCYVTITNGLLMNWEKVTQREKEKYSDREAACTYLYCTTATIQELSYFSMMWWMLQCISIFPQVPLYTLIHVQYLLSSWINIM